MRKTFGLFVLLYSGLGMAGGYSEWSSPTRIDVERSGGFMVYGSFGNPGGCSVGNRFYVQVSHPQYDKMYAAVLAAYSAGTKVRAYLHDCGPVTWYSVSSTTYNYLTSSGVLQVSK